MFYFGNNNVLFYFGKLIAGLEEGTRRGTCSFTSSLRSEMLSLPLQRKYMTSHPNISGMDMSRTAQKESKEDNGNILNGYFTWI